MEMEESSYQLVLPTDLILEIVARSISDDPATVIRCAATSKHLRRAILHPPFLRRLRTLTDDGHRSKFIPSLFLGLFQQVQPERSPLAFVPATAAAAGLALTLPDLPHDVDNADQTNHCVLGPYSPVASRRSLLVLRRYCAKYIDVFLDQHRHGERAVELSVCNPVTGGQRWVLPPPAVHDQTHALLDVDTGQAPPSFKLLVAHLRENSAEMVVQVFSSEDRAWGPPLACRIPRVRCSFPVAGSPKPVVRRGAIHWLCSTDTAHDEILKWRWQRRGKEPKALLLDVPLAPGLSRHRTMCLALSPSSTDMDKTSSSSSLTLSVVALLEGQIEVWVRTGRAKEGSSSSSSSSCWERHRVIVEEEIARPVGFPEGWLGVALLRSFCDGSGTLLLDQYRIRFPPWLLKLETNSISMALSDTPVNFWFEFFPYEVDLLTYMLHVMKVF